MEQPLPASRLKGAIPTILGTNGRNWAISRIRAAAIQLAIIGIELKKIATHLELYELIHEVRARRGISEPTGVGVAMHIRVFDGLTWLGRRTASLVDTTANTNSLFI